MILIDYSGVCLANMFAFQSEMRKGMDDEGKAKAINTLRHSVLTTIKFYKHKFGKEYGNVVIACDGRSYWRKEVFQYYKANRKANREESDIDWKLIFDTLEQLRIDLINNFPYKVVLVDRAEADDVIAVLVKWAQENELTQQGLFEAPQKILIASADGDFVQLQKYDGVRQWSPQQKKFVTTKNLTHFMHEHILKAGDDGIPPITCPDDFYVNKEKYGRAPSIRQAKLDKFLAEGREACANDDERRNWDRNQRLIDFDYIPEDVSKEIIDSYTNQVVKGNKSLIMNYLIKHRCRLLLDDIEGF